MSFRGVPPVPMWAAGNVQNIERLPIIPGVKTLTILADNDLSGQGLASAHKCRERWVGRSGAIFVPNILGTDFNDIAHG
jgi:Toprim domain